VARAAWSEAMLPAADWLALDRERGGTRIPYLLAIDGEERCTASSSICG
jgi:hypothetical protein